MLSDLPLSLSLFPLFPSRLPTLHVSAWLYFCRQADFQLFVSAENDPW